VERKLAGKQTNMTKNDAQSCSKLLWLPWLQVLDYGLHHVSAKS
jgi:hypothetical protein